MKTVQDHSISASSALRLERRARDIRKFCSGNMSRVCDDFSRLFNMGPCNDVMRM